MKLELDQFSVAKMIPRKFHSQIQNLSGWWQFIRPFPCHPVMAVSQTVIKGKPVMVLLEHLRRLRKNNRTHSEDRPGIALPERLQGIQLVKQGVINLLGAYPGGNRQGLFQQAVLRVPFDGLDKHLAKVIQLVLRDGNAHRHGMTAPALQIPAAGCQHLHQTEPFKAASGSLGQLSLIAENNAGAIIFPGNAPGDNTDDSGMPVFAVEHNPGIVPVVFLDHVFRLSRHLALDILPLAVKSIKLSGSFLAEMPVPAQQQIH